jgi:hypothetical protein
MPDAIIAAATCTHSFLVPPSFRVARMRLSISFAAARTLSSVMVVHLLSACSFVNNYTSQKNACQVFFIDERIFY